jgi:uncharacterized protein (DUF305 family)
MIREDPPFRYLCALGFALLCLGTGQALAQATKPDAMPGSMPMDAGMPAGPEAKAFDDANRQMMNEMPKKQTGNADQDFAANMLPHHQGAVDMAKIELQYGKDPLLRKMAEDIIKSQNEEIATLQKWQAAHAQNTGGSK